LRPACLLFPPFPPWGKKWFAGGMAWAESGGVVRNKVAFFRTRGRRGGLVVFGVIGASGMAWRGLIPNGLLYLRWRVTGQGKEHLDNWRRCPHSNGLKHKLGVSSSQFRQIKQKERRGGHAWIFLHFYHKFVRPYFLPHVKNMEKDGVDFCPPLYLRHWQKSSRSFVRCVSPRAELLQGA